MEYGNLAYKAEYYFPRYNTTPQRKQSAVIGHRTDKRKYRRYIFVIITIALAAGFMISTFVTVNETRAEVKSLETYLLEMEAITSQKAFDLDHSIDLATIEEEATTRLGMKRPEKYQTVYVNVSREDVTEKTVGEVENAKGRISDTLKAIIGNIVEFFSIK